MRDMHDADAIIVATHSQGSIVSTHLLDRLIQDGHIRTARSIATRTGVEAGLETTGAAAGTKKAGPGALVDTFAAAGVEALTSVGISAMKASGSSAGIPAPNRQPQRICCLALCGIHLGPLRYLSSSSLLLPYIQVCRYLIAIMVQSVAHGLCSFSTLNPRRRRSYSNSRSVVRRTSFLLIQFSVPGAYLMFSPFL
jgi:hypothetical protein